MDPKEAGQLVGAERDEVKHRFLRGEIDILVCTDAAAEGLNLQTADLLVNFDLPWNPMKVEQRIGRIDRIGQRHCAIYVLNLCYADSAEEIVYGRLLRRLAEAGAIVGTQQISLLPVTREEFQQLAERRLSAVEIERMAKERAIRARERTASMEVAPGELYEIYSRLSREREHQQIPVDLTLIWETLTGSNYLKDLGCRHLPDTDKPVMILAGIEGIPDGTAITTSRNIFEEGLPGLEGRLHFATYGDAAFEAILSQIGRFDLPPSVKRIEARIPGTEGDMAGYAVAHVTGEGERECRLVTSLHRLETIRIDEERGLTGEDVEPLKGRLTEMVNEEFRYIPAVSRIEAANEQAGRSQAALTLLVIQYLIQVRQRTKRGDSLFWREIAALDETFKKKDLVRAEIPLSSGKQLTGLLFDLVVPPSGDTGHVNAPRPLLFAALGSACRLANGMKVKRSELATDQFLARLEREIGRVAGHKNNPPLFQI